MHGSLELSVKMFPILIIIVRHSIMIVQTVIAVFSYSLNSNLTKEVSLLWEEYPEYAHSVLKILCAVDQKELSLLRMFFYVRCQLLDLAIEGIAAAP